MGGLSEQRHRADGTPYTYTRQRKQPWRPTPQMKLRMLAAIDEDMTLREQCDAAIVAAGISPGNRAHHTIVRAWVREQGLPCADDAPHQDQSDSALRVRCVAMLRIMARAARRVTWEVEDAAATA